MALRVEKSNIEGMGLFAMQPFSCSSVVVKAGFINNRTFHESKASAFVNHSDNPNLFVRIEDNNVTLNAKKDITGGEELTINYKEMQYLLETNRVNLSIIGIPVGNRIFGMSLDSSQNGQLDLLKFESNPKHYSRLNTLLKKSHRYEGIVFME